MLLLLLGRHTIIYLGLGLFVYPEPYLLFARSSLIFFFLFCRRRFVFPSRSYNATAVTATAAIATAAANATATATTTPKHGIIIQRNIITIQSNNLLDDCGITTIDQYEE